MLDNARHRLRRYGMAVLAVALAAWARAALEPVLGDHAPLGTFYLAVLLAGWYGGIGPSILATGLGILAADFWFIPPHGALLTYQPAHAVELAVYALVTVAFALLSGSLQELRRRAQARSVELAEIEQRTQAIVDHVLDGIITIDAHGIVQLFNPAAETIFGYSAAEVLGRNVSVLMPEPDRSRHGQYVEKYLRTGETKVIGIGREVLGRRKDGTTFPLDLAVSEFRIGAGRFFVGVARDITERKRAQQTARFLADASAALAALIDYESTLQTTAQLAVPFFADWCVVDVLENDGSLQRAAIAHGDRSQVERLRQLGRRHPPSPWLPRGPAHVAHTGTPEIVAEISDAVLREMARSPEHLQTLRALRLKSYISVPLKVHGKAFGAISYATAESDRRYREADLEVAQDLAHHAAIAIENARLYEEARDADRRKDEFLAMLAHELRNPLAPIRSGLDLMGMEGVDDETVRWARNVMKEQMEHLVRLVDDLLDVSRITRGKIVLRKQVLDLSTLVTRGVETVRPFIESRGHELAVSLPPEPVWLEADPIRMTQVIANLLSNAAKYNDKAGHIWLSARRDGMEAVIRVRDDGIGIPAELLPRIFDLFTQADRSLERSQGGLGIGLTLARSLVELHGGSIIATSEGPGKGAELVVRLPAQPAPPAGNGKTPGDPTEQRAAVSLRLLIVDDNVGSATTVGRIAERWGHMVQLAHNGLAALELAKTFRPDVILLDIGLPGMNGYDVARQLRAQPEFANVVLIAVTGYGQEEDRRRSSQAGFDHHLVKPVAPNTLRQLLAETRAASEPAGKA